MRVSMKKDFNILSSLIPVPKSSGVCLNVFVQPLIDELKMLWDKGVVTYDRLSMSSFPMREMVVYN